MDHDGFGDLGEGILKLWLEGMDGYAGHQCRMIQSMNHSALPPNKKPILPLLEEDGSSGVKEINPTSCSLLFIEWPVLEED